MTGGYIFSRPSINGSAILKICLNPYLPRYQNLRESEPLLPSGQAVLDRIRGEKEDRAYIPDAEIERKEQELTQGFPLFDPVVDLQAELTHFYV